MHMYVLIFYICVYRCVYKCVCAVLAKPLPFQKNGRLVKNKSSCFSVLEQSSVLIARLEAPTMAQSSCKTPLNLGRCPPRKLIMPPAHVYESF